MSASKVFPCALVVALLFVPQVSPAAKPPSPEFCKKVIGKEARVLMRTFAKEGANCEKLKMSGDLAQNRNCNTNLIEYLPPSINYPPMVERVDLARARMYKLLHYDEARSKEGACFGVAGETEVLTPCDGISDSEDLWGCISYDGQATFIGNIHDFVFDQSKKLADDYAACKLGASRIALRFTESFIRTHNKCGEKAAAGKTCRSESDQVRLAANRTKSSSKIVKICDRFGVEMGYSHPTDPEQSLYFGPSVAACADDKLTNSPEQYDDGQDSHKATTDCLLEAVEVWARRAAQVLYDVPGY